MPATKTAYYVIIRDTRNDEVRESGWGVYADPETADHVVERVNERERIRGGTTAVAFWRETRWDAERYLPSLADGKPLDCDSPDFLTS
ncbi:hypothetical protein [Herbidospora cretacea]|uniref:hypothetical protein n=1 Tax=Herbidospora cretacea TaxID=28444 RepID=UPI0012FA97D9|nr:hypothetical protein [Herbidospora cretacea]